MNSEFLEIDVDSVEVRGVIRDEPGDCAMLAASIDKLGVLAPVLIDRNNVLIDGRRRLEACRQAGVSRVAALRLDTTFDSMTALEVQVDLNLCREPMTNQELERLIQRKKTIADSDDRTLLDRLRRCFKKR